MGRKNVDKDDGGLADLIDRNAGGGLETGDGVGVADDVAEEAQSAANLACQTDRGAVKRANFSRLASKRVSGVLERLSVLENLANTNTYDWTQQQHDKIFNAIDEQLKEVRKAFEAAKKPKVRDKSQLRFEV
jgi:hypothetical protein